VLLREGPCDRRFSPMSSFKLPIAIMGFDAGILQDPHHPLWDYSPDYHAVERDHKPVDPTIWLRDSVVWYSQQITQRLGMERFQDYLRRFAYGNQDLSGNPGKNDGLTQAWLMSSLQISPDEQVGFIKRFLGRALPVDGHALEMVHASMPVYAGEGGWTVHGKTGSGYFKDASGVSDESRPLGWFVGWADKGDRRVAFTRMTVGTAKLDQFGGFVARAEVLAKLDSWTKA